MKVFKKHIKLIGKCPNWLDIQGNNRWIRIPNFYTENQDLEEEIQKCLDAYKEDTEGKNDAFIYTAYHEKSKKAFVCVVDEECEFLGQPVEG